jgi:hypothetical protein
VEERGREQERESEEAAGEFGGDCHGKWGRDKALTS